MSAVPLGPLGEAALAYAARGIPVLPLHWPTTQPHTTARDGEQPGVLVGCSCRDPACAKPGKHPLGRLVAHGIDQATTDPDQVTRWWQRAPHANIGLATGHLVDVLDVDGPAGAQALRAFAAAHGWTPRGPLVRTGGGGWHLYLHPSGSGPKAPIHPDLLAHVDWRGRGSYAVAPPSQHAGGAYRWVRGLDTPLQPAPPALLALLHPRQPARPTPVRPVEPGHPYAMAVLDAECDQLARTPQGRRNRALFDAGLRTWSLALGGALDPTEVQARLAQAARASGLGQRETADTLNSVRRIAARPGFQPRGVPERPAPTPAQRPLAPRARTEAERRPGPAGDPERG